MQLALLEDDLNSANQVINVMAECGHQVKHCRDAKSFLRAVRHDSFDLILLDWSLPVSSGLEVLSWVQAHVDPAPPTIMITARTTEADIVQGLTQGAADYLAKPIHNEVLKARVEALLRRVYGSRAKAKAERFGKYVFNVLERSIALDGVPMTTTAKEFDLAHLLFRNLNRPLSRNYIVDTVWASAPDVLSRTLDAHISQVRKRLKLTPENGLRLSSVYAFGYRLEEYQTVAADLADTEDDPHPSIM